MSDDKRKRPSEDAIDANLRRVFQPTLEEDVPDRFRDLLKQLADKEVGKVSGGDQQG